MLMPAGTHSIEIDVGIEQVWEFVSDMDKWAPLVPGYLEHKIINEQQSTWTFVSDSDIIQKTLKLQVDITEWSKPTLIIFDLKGLNEKFAGNGYFQATELGPNKTKITGNIDLLAKGMMGPMINRILKNMIPKIAEELTDAVANKINEVYA